jgi:hypothetical protein
MPEGRVLEGVRIDSQAFVVHCKSCGALIWWGYTPAGKANPFDVVDGARTAITHFSTCPDAPRWTKKRSD